MAKLIFFTVFILTFFVRFWAVKDYNFAFTIDQGRDMIDIRSIAITHKPRLIGPTTSINGVYLGPFWYYFNLPAFIISGGDPAAILLWQITSYQLVGLLIYYLVRKPNSHLAFFASVFFLIMPLGFYINRYSWNANAMPTYAALFLLLLFWAKQKPSSVRVFLLGLVAGLAFQIEAAFGIIFFPFSFFYLLFITRKIKVHAFHLVGFLLTILPQGFFEIRHQFPLTKVLLAEIGGKSTMLGEKLSFADRFSDRVSTLTRLLQDTSHLPTAYLFPLFALVCLLTFVLILKRLPAKPLMEFYLVNLLFLVFAAIFFLIFPQALKNWYLLGLSVPLVFLYASSLAALFSQGGLWKWATVSLIIASFYFTYTAQAEYLSVARQMGAKNKSSLKNEITVLDWVYTHAKGEGFLAYSYLPSVYDYPYQYLYWWYGAEKYAYRPNYVAYLPGQPEYIANMTAYFTQTRPLPGNEPTFLIIEKDQQNPNFEKAWLGNFAKLCLLETKEFAFGVEVRSLQKCSP